MFNYLLCGVEIYSGKSTFMNALGARAVPIPEGIDVFHLKEEVEASDTITAIEAVMSVDVERNNLEQEAEKLNTALAQLAEQQDDGGDGGDDDEGDGLTMEEQQEKLMDALNYIYERLDLLDAATAETRARSILKGLGFTHEMQGKLTKDFSGGWRMRVSLARALFNPLCFCWMSLRIISTWRPSFGSRIIFQSGTKSCSSFLTLRIL